MTKRDTRPTSKAVSHVKAKLLETQYKFILLEEKELEVGRCGNGYTLSCPWCDSKAWLYPTTEHVIVFHCENDSCKHHEATLSQFFGKHSRKTQTQYNEAMSRVRQGYAQRGKLE